MEFKKGRSDVMAVMYSLSQRPIGGRRLYFANTQTTGVVPAEELCRRIALRCGLKRPVLLAALMAFSEAMEGELAMGRIVDLGEMGRFQVSCGSTGVEQADEFCIGRDMRDAKILFRPGKGLKRMLKGLEYKRISVRR